MELNEVLNNPEYPVRINRLKGPFYGLSSGNTRGTWRAVKTPSFDVANFPVNFGWTTKGYVQGGSQIYFLKKEDAERFYTKYFGQADAWVVISLCNAIETDAIRVDIGGDIPAYATERFISENSNKISQEILDRLSVSAASNPFASLEDQQKDAERLAVDELENKLVDLSKKVISTLSLEESGKEVIVYKRVNCVEMESFNHILKGLPQLNFEKPFKFSFDIKLIYDNVRKYIRNPNKNKIKVITYIKLDHKEGAVNSYSLFFKIFKELYPDLIITTNSYSLYTLAIFDNYLQLNSEDSIYNSPEYPDYEGIRFSNSSQSDLSRFELQLDSSNLLSEEYLFGILQDKLNKIKDILFKFISLCNTVLPRLGDLKSDEFDFDDEE